MPVKDPREAILSAALFSRNVAVDLCSFLRPEDFTDGQRPIYQAVHEALSTGDSVEISSVIAFLEKGGVIDPYKYLLPYMDDDDPANRNFLVDTAGRKAVMEHIRNRRVRDELGVLVSQLRYDEIPGYVKSLESSGATEDKRTEGLITEGKISEFISLIKDNRTRKTLGYSTGLQALDELTGGMVRGMVWAIGAPTSAGKTTLLCQMVAEAMRTGAVCLLFSLEMALPLMYARLAGAVLGINPTAIYRGRITDEQMLAVQGTLEFFRECGLRVYREITDAEEIVQRSREAKISKGRVDVVAVDFIQNVATAEGRNILQHMAEATKILQKLAGDLNCCTLIASQLSNDGVREKAGGIFSYRYASELAHAADVGIELVPSGNGPTDLHVRKNRHGPTGRMTVRFNECFSAFRDDSQPIPRWQDTRPGY